MAKPKRRFRALDPSDVCSGKCREETLAIHVPGPVRALGGLPMSSKKRSLARRRSGYLASPYFAWSKRHALSGLGGGSHRITSERQLRREFWQTFPTLQRKKIPNYSGKGTMHVTDTRVTFNDWVDGLSKNGEISQELAQRATLGGLRGLHGTSMPTWTKEWKPKDLLGVGAAGAGAAAARFFAAPGTFLSRHAGLIGALAGLLIGGVTKNARSGLTGALAGLSFEALEYATDAKIASGV